MSYLEQMQQDCARVEEWLRTCFMGREPRADLYDAMRYSLLAGGKRLRPVLLLESCRMCGGDVEGALPFACAVEMLHTYSLIHDDLPAMDNDDLRRGRPTNHKVYGEATAILAGDGLLTAAFETMLEHGGDLPAPRVLAAAACLGRAAGARGMVGGQALDMAGEGHALALADVEELQRLKTGALIAAAAEMGCILAGGGAEARAAVRRYAEKLGLAFQIRDDMLDVEGDEATLGKPIGSDAENEKTTFVTLKGLEWCQDAVERLTREAQEALDVFPEAGFLCWLAGELVARKK
ncbi:MAG TPA: polyprenyl synthetase family protein [Candidatus Flavonifractor intestinipullorum]|uniref:Farnesyl diphosphate synthase n=1 Tax=Candidatus Flavonifractor intestinipullorum TaxID=2838587 RepID=A0A9D2S437_9FIRM|nr:polyprenyl synthetase family protein [Candidatus Flavonifractor intestinipullorum]